SRLKMTTSDEAEIEKAHAAVTEEYARTFLERAMKVAGAARQLAIAGIAIAWLFKSDGGTGLALPRLLGIALILFVFCLVVDLLQGIALAIQSELWHQM